MPESPPGPFCQVLGYSSRDIHGFFAPADYMIAEGDLELSWSVLYLVPGRASRNGLLLSRMEGAVIQPRIALLTGTFGVEAQNGVGRFLSGLQKYSAERSYPLEVFSAGDHLGNYPGVHNIHALSFPIPQFEAVNLYYPLEGRRRQLRRMIRGLTPDLLHVSTPDAIGVTGLAIAKRLARPVAAIYHTDFPAFGRHLVEQALKRLVNQHQPLETLLALGGPALGRAYEEIVKHLTFLERSFLRRALCRNREHLAELLGRGSSWVADTAQVVVQELMFQFYSQCQLVIARSDVYRTELIEQIERENPPRWCGRQGCFARENAGGRRPAAAPRDSREGVGRFVCWSSNG